MLKISEPNENLYTNEDADIFHFSLEALLPTSHLLALNVKTRTLSLLTEGPLIVKQQQLTDNEMRVIMPILEFFPHYCPYEVLLSSISSTTVTSTSIMRWRQRLEEAQNRGTWQQELRPLRRALSSLRGKLHLFSLEIPTVRERGCSLTSLMPAPMQISS